MDMSIRFPGADLVLENVEKTLHIFGIDITFYGILISMGMILALAFIVLEAKRSHENVNHYLDAMILAILFGVAGARALYVGFYWDLYKGDVSRILNIREGGLAIYGGIAGGIVAVLLVSLICRESFWKMADILCLGVLLGQALGRWGDFLNRSSFGEYTEWPTAMQLPLAAVHSSEVTPLMRENMVMIGDVPFIQVHPCFLYESVWCLLLWIILMISRRRKLFDGEIFLRYITGYSFGRMFIEWLRTDKLLIPGTEVSVNLVISVTGFLFFVIMLMIRSAMARKRIDYRRHRKELKYEYEERLAKQEAERDRLRKESAASAEPEMQTGHRAAELPDDVRSLLEDIEQEQRKAPTSVQAADERTAKNTETAEPVQTLSFSEDSLSDEPAVDPVDAFREDTEASVPEPGEKESLYDEPESWREHTQTEEDEGFSEEQDASPFRPDAARGVPFDMTYEELLGGDDQE